MLFVLKGKVMNKNEIRQLIENKGFNVIKECRYKNIAWRFKLSNGVSVFCGDGNKIWFSGKNKVLVEEEISHMIPEQINTKVFIVYGRDDGAKNELIGMVESWGLEALTIDRLPVHGRTIIEQLEHYIPQTNYGVVLATPDDIGCLDDGNMDIKHRARQNVVLELGMLFAKLGRSRVTVLVKSGINFERPSDIAGIMYKEYVNSVYEQEESIKRELNSLGYSVS